MYFSRLLNHRKANEVCGLFQCLIYAIFLLKQGLQGYEPI